jgi:hypothetical protein
VTFSKPYIDALAGIDLESIHFLDNIAPMTVSAREEAFLSQIAIIAYVCRLDVPNLENAASCIGAEPYGFYTSKTYKEYHQVLCRLLELLKERLVKLSESRGPKDDPKGYATCLEDVVFVGIHLFWMVDGQT